MRFFLPLAALAAFFLLVVGTTGCGENAVVVPPPIGDSVSLSVATITSDINHGTRVFATVENLTDQPVDGVILWIGNDRDDPTKAQVEMWYGLTGMLPIVERTAIETGQKYYPGLSARRDNGSEWYWTGDEINGEDGLIIGRLAPHATVEVASWFITF